VLLEVTAPFVPALYALRMRIDEAFRDLKSTRLGLSLEHCLDDDSSLVPSTRYLLRLAAAAQWRGLVTGIRWGLPPSMQIAIDDAIRRKDWGAKVKVGWDPTHPRATDRHHPGPRAGGWAAEVEGDTRQRKSTPRRGYLIEGACNCAIELRAASFLSDFADGAIISIPLGLRRCKGSNQLGTGGRSMVAPHPRDAYYAISKIG
jgi:hypothetical protein